MAIIESSPSGWSFFYRILNQGFFFFFFFLDPSLIVLRCIFKSHEGVLRSKIELPYTQQAAENNSASRSNKTDNKNILEHDEHKLKKWLVCSLSSMSIMSGLFVCVFWRPIIVWRQELILLLLRDPRVTCQSCSND